MSFSYINLDVLNKAVMYIICEYILIFRFYVINEWRGNEILQIAFEMSFTKDNQSIYMAHTLHNDSLIPYTSWLRSQFYIPRLTEVS